MYKISFMNKEDFHQFINGLYQAEETAGAYFLKEDSLNLNFLFSIGQNYSPEALKVFLNLQKILKTGSVRLSFNSKGVPHIRYIVSNANIIFDRVLPYFSLLYGQKRKDLVVLYKIYKLFFQILKN